MAPPPLWRRPRGPLAMDILLIFHWACRERAPPPLWPGPSGRQPDFRDSVNAVIASYLRSRIGWPGSAKEHSRFVVCLRGLKRGHWHNRPYLHNPTFVFSS